MQSNRSKFNDIYSDLSKCMHKTLQNLNQTNDKTGKETAAYSSETWGFSEMWPLKIN
jgi:hypothetical protein